MQRVKLDKLRMGTIENKKSRNTMSWNRDYYSDLFKFEKENISRKLISKNMADNQ